MGKIHACLMAVLALVIIVNCGNDNGVNEPSGETSNSEIVVSTDGGTVTTEDNVVQLVVPKDAITSDVTVTIEETENCPSGIVGCAYDFGPDGLQFEKPVELIVTYDESDIPTGVDESTLKLCKSVDGEWQDLSDNTVNTEENTVSATIQSFSVYGITSSDSTGQENPIEINSDTAAKINEINTQVCKVLAKAREVNIGFLLMKRGIEKDFMIPGVVSVVYDDEQLNWMAQGIMQTREAMDALNGELEILQSLEDELAGTEKSAITGKGIAKWCIRKGLGNFGKKLTMVEDELCEVLYQYTRFLIEKVVDMPDCSGDWYCDDLKALNCAMKRACGENLGKKPWLKKNYDESIENATIIDEMTWIELSKFNSFLLDPSGCVTYREFYNDFLKDCLSDLVREGMKAYAETYWKIYTDRLEALTDINVNDYIPSEKVAATTNAGTADAVIFLVPSEDSFDSLPIFMAAPVSENGSLHLPDIYEGTYSMYIYSEGNAPTVLENVNISSSSPTIQAPPPASLNNAEPADFPAEPAGDPYLYLNPEPAGCPTCKLTDAYELEYTVKYYENLPTNEMTAEGKTTIPFEILITDSLCDTVVVRNDIEAKFNYTGKTSNDTEFVFSPAQFTITLAYDWTIERSIENGEECFYILDIEIAEDASQTLTFDIVDHGTGETLTSTGEVNALTMDYLWVLPSRTKIGSEPPITWEFSDPEQFDPAVHPQHREAKVVITEAN